MNEREEFADDLAHAGVDFLDLANALHERGAVGDCWFGVLGYLVLQLSELVAGNNASVELTKNEMRVAVRAFTNIARTFKILKGPKRDLLPEKDWEFLTPFGEMLNKVWNQIPGEEKIRTQVFGYRKPKHPAR